MNCKCHIIISNEYFIHNAVFSRSTMSNVIYPIIFLRKWIFNLRCTQATRINPAIYYQVNHSDEFTHITLRGT